MLTCCFKAVRCHEMSHEVMWWWFQRNAQLNNIMGKSLFPTLWERQNTLKGAGFYWLIATLYTVTDNLFYIAANLCLCLRSWIFFWNKFNLIIYFDSNIEYIPCLKMCPFLDLFLCSVHGIVGNGWNRTIYTTIQKYGFSKTWLN